MDITTQTTRKTRPEFGRWRHIPGGMTPGGTPVFVCDNCGGSEHLHGAEFPKRKFFCDECGQINFYPWDRLVEEDE